MRVLPKLFTILTLLLCKPFLIHDVHASDKSTVRLGLSAIPPMNFSPFRNTGLPYVYTWSAVFEGLTKIDANGNLKPLLATSWESTDELTWVIDLRKGVKFSNGRPFDANSVVNIVKFLTSDEASIHLVSRMMFFLKSAKAIDSHKVEISTNVPTPLLPRFLTMLYALEPIHFNDVGLDEFSRKPVATGPFDVEKIGPTKIYFKSFDESWRKPRVKKLEIIAIPDSSVRTFSLISGEIDIAMQIGPEETLAIKSRGGNEVIWRDPETWGYHFLTIEDSPLMDIKVREALNLAVDRDSIIKSLLYDSTIPANQPAPPPVYGYNEKLPPIDYDPERAKQLLIDAGYPNGFTFILETSIGASANADAINQVVAQYLSRVGVNMLIRAIPVNQLIRNVIEGTWSGDAFGIHYSFQPTVEVLKALDTHSCLWPKAWYCKKEIMPTLRAAQTTFDKDKNLQFRKDIMEFYRNDWAAIFMYQAPRFAGTVKGLKGFLVENNVISYDKIYKLD